jgi:hypothetical protein
VVVGLSAINWVVLIPATACWPVAGLVVYFVARSARRHDEGEAREHDE